MTTNNLDNRVAEVVDEHGLEGDEDDLIAELENDAALDGFREQRLQQLHAEYVRAKAMKNQEHGTYSEIKDEKALMDITTSTERCVVHFFKSDFNRCRIMHGHLEALAPKHFDTRFLCIDVDNAPFLVVKLKVQVLPCVLTFVGGVSKDRIVGFEGIGYGSDSFTTKDLESRLLEGGVLLRATNKLEDGSGSFHQSTRHGINKAVRADDYESDDDDWD